MRIQRYDQNVKIWASANDTYKWANRIHESWPCSELSGNRVFIELDKGDLVDFALNGKDHDMDANELNAFIEDTLKEYDKTLVIFRKFKEGDIIALFPEIEHRWPFCSSYQHIGQHSGADYNGLIQITKLAAPEEYSDLKTELESIGYNLKIRRKYNRSH